MRRFGPMTVAFFIALAAVVAVPGTTLADDAEKPSILSPRFDLTLWTIVVFGLLYLVLRYVKLPGASAPAFVMMMEGLRKREHNIQHALNEAQKARAEAEGIRSQLQAEMAKAHEKVREILDEARRDAQAATEDMIAKTRAEIQTERDRLRREIDTARDQALQELWSQSAQLATLISAKAIQRQLNADDHRRLVDMALSELRQAGDQRQRDMGERRA